MSSAAPSVDTKSAVTHYRTLRSKGGYSLLEVRLETGRKNQIRAHLAEAGHPVVGDQLYGSKSNPIERLGLHAKLLAFTHPGNGKKMSFTIEIPKGFRTLIGDE